MVGGSAQDILDDIWSNERGFLPGAAPKRDEVISHLSGSILLSGLTQEESWLVLSTLPKGVEQVFFAPLDKGLSGSKVYSGRYKTVNGLFSRPFVFKLGLDKKLTLERDAIEELVTPHLSGISRPVFRTNGSCALLVQDFAGLSDNAELQSLKDIALTPDGYLAVRRLLNERFSSWYRNGSEEILEHRLGQAFEWYLTKVGEGDVYPASWAALKNRVSDATGFNWCDPRPVIASLCVKSVKTRATVVHGDLHSQNVLVDQRGETWPIDFAWCRSGTTPLLDFTMLECSLKFLALPQQSDIHDLIKIEADLLSSKLPRLKYGQIPYKEQICNVMKAVLEVRKCAFNYYKINYLDYRRALCIMTYVHSTHRRLNRPFVLASLQMLCAMEGG